VKKTQDIIFLILVSSKLPQTGVTILGFTTTFYLNFSALSPKFKRVSLNETLEFPFWGLKICVDFDLRDSKKMENMKKLNKKYFITKNIDIHKTAQSHS